MSTEFENPQQISQREQNRRDRAQRRDDRRARRNEAPSRTKTLGFLGFIIIALAVAVVLWIIGQVSGIGNTSSRSVPVSTSTSVSVSPDNESTGSATATNDAATPSATPTFADTEEGQPGAGQDGISPWSEEFRQAWKTVVPQFSAVFGNPSVGKTAWLEGLKPYSTDRLLSLYADLPEDLSPVRAFTYGSYNVVRDESNGGGWMTIQVLDDKGNKAVTLGMVMDTEAQVWRVDKVG